MVKCSVTLLWNEEEENAMGIIEKVVAVQLINSGPSPIIHNCFFFLIRLC